jgi:hypothetical protein
MRNVHRSLAGNPDKKTLKKRGVNMWTGLAYDGIQWRAVVNTVMNTWAVSLLADGISSSQED